MSLFRPSDPLPPTDFAGNVSPADAYKLGFRDGQEADRAAADRRDEKVWEYYEAASAIVEAVRFGHPIPQAYWTRYGLAGAAVREEYTTDKGEPR